MKITVLAVGKVKERFYREAIAEYTKRLGRYCRLEIVEVSDEKTPDGAAPAMERQIKEKEGERILSHVREGSYVVALALEGMETDSPGLAERIETWSVSGVNQLVFIIGGSLGLSDSVLSRADFKLSFSKLTFPHQLMRVLVLEQLYRSYRIIHKQPYHK
ncbi:MAG: 23S rRNA (pseudouridine(1915)-N(3))-methyltransferase RlmH [Lachnospiraceae bacterium]|jgi:23S rRNA (pseudouridine1915-N3)-methyltransferase|nr:23S rRNA (pseudouridine(1915)-N(3))-methyltransferase RlmH [Lachnospiraceae bacterium]